MVDKVLFVLLGVLNDQVNADKHKNVPSGLIEGKNTSLGVGLRLSACHTSTPLALPAAMAAPNAVVSDIVGRTVNSTFSFHGTTHTNKIHSLTGIPQ